LKNVTTLKVLMQFVSVVNTQCFEVLGKNLCLLVLKQLEVGIN